MSLQSILDAAGAYRSIVQTPKTSAPPTTEQIEWRNQARQKLGLPPSPAINHAPLKVDPSQVWSFGADGKLYRVFPDAQPLRSSQQVAAAYSQSSGGRTPSEAVIA